MLNEPDATEQRRSEAPAYPRSIDTPPSRLAFYPLTMPLTTGPGTISVAISIGASRPGGIYASLISFFIETLAATLLLVLLVYGFYRNSGAPRGSHRPDGNDHRRAPVGLPAVLHRHPGVLERRGRVARAFARRPDERLRASRARLSAPAAGLCAASTRHTPWPSGARRRPHRRPRRSAGVRAMIQA